MTDLKTSLLINRQVPEYVREEYPLFLSFLEAYYEFLETKQGAENNDLTTQAKKLKNISDVDLSIDEFENQFFNTFASLLPRDAVVDKSFLLKNILPLYQSKGSENSFKLLFRFLFGEEIEIRYPKDNILRASAGNWKIPQTLKVSSDVSSVYTGNGTKTTFKLLQEVEASNIQVFVNDVRVTTGFIVLKDYSKIIFNSALSNGAKLEIFYTNYLFTSNNNNRQLIGNTSGASCVIESFFPRKLNNNTVYELYVDLTSLTGEFQIGEVLNSSLWIGEELIDVRFRTISELQQITVLDSGANYNVGDPVLINAPQSEIKPTAFISKVYSGNIDRLNILDGGAGFAIGGDVFINGFGPPFVQAEVNSVLTVFANSANTFLVTSDVITDIDPANTTIGAGDYGLSGVVSGNANSIIGTTFSDIAFANIGEIIGLDFTLAQIEVASSPIIDVEPAKIYIPNTGFTTVNTQISIRSFGSLGKMRINNPGNGYQVGDEVIFTNQPASFGLGAAAEVTEANANGAIIRIDFVPAKIEGTTNGSSSNVIVIGTGTYFERDLLVGSSIKINGQNKTVSSIASNTSLNVNSVFSSSFNNKPLRLYGKYLLGGQSYEQDFLPTISISSVAGANANVVVTAIMGDGEIVTASLGNNRPGGIQTITVLNAGKSLRVVPAVDLTASGDGTAVGEAVLVPSFEEFEGRWTNSDGLLSSNDMKLQGLNYYINYSYVLISQQEFKKYKNVLLGLIHPGGSAPYAEVYRQDDINAQEATIETEITLGSS
jgi:hypothetical protein